MRHHHLFRSALSRAAGLQRIAVLGAVLAVCALTPATAFASSTGAARPAAIQPGTAGLHAVSPDGASGGGCSPSTPLYANGIAYASVSACISESQGTINADAYTALYYVTYPYVVNCWYAVSIRDDTAATTVARVWFNDCGNYQGPVRVSAVPGHHYHTYVWTELELNTGNWLLWTTAAGSVNSPELSAG